MGNYVSKLNIYTCIFYKIRNILFKKFYSGVYCWSKSIFIRFYSLLLIMFVHLLLTFFFGWVNGELGVRKTPGSISNRFRRAEIFIIWNFKDLSTSSLGLFVCAHLFIIDNVKSNILCRWGEYHNPLFGSMLVEEH